MRDEAAWPLSGTRWAPLYLHKDGALREAPAAHTETVRFDTTTGRASFVWQPAVDVELVGPMKLRLHVEVRGADNVHLFAGVRKLRGGRHVVFEGSCGFSYEMVTGGWLKASHRRLDEERSAPWQPVRRHDASEPLQPGQIVPVEIELLPSATLLRGGEVLRLDVQGRWFYGNNPFLGQFPAAYEPSPPATAVLHCGDGFDAHLLVPLPAGGPDQST